MLPEDPTAHEVGTTKPDAMVRRALADGRKLDGRRLRRRGIVAMEVKS